MATARKSRLAPVMRDSDSGTRSRRVSACAALLMLMALSGSSAAQTPPTATSATASGPVAVPAFRQANQVAILTIHTGDGMIDRVTLKSLERRMKKARQAGADAVVLDIDTLGGRMDAALDICNLLKDRNETPVNAVAWIHPKAYSAGTIIALACREIVVAPGATFGDAAPIELGPLGLQSLPDTERAKVLGPLLTEMIDSARRNHYDEKLIQSFIMLGQELWMIENIQSGERVFVDRAEYNRVIGQEPSGPSGTARAPSKSASRRSVYPWIDRSIPRVSDRAAMDTAQLKQQSEFEQSLPPVRAALTEADRGKWRPVMQVIDANSLLTVKADEALYYGLAVAVVANDQELKSFFGAKSLRRYDETWSEGLVRFLTNFWVRGLLIAIFLICLFIEMAMPGFGVFGTTAVVALLILVGAPALAGMADWWEILLIVVGLLLVAAEVFLLPGFGLPGIAGVICLLVGMVGTFVSDDLTTTSGQDELWTGMATVLLSIFAAGIAIWFISRSLHTLPIVNQFILSTELKSSENERRGGGLLEAMGAAQRALQEGDMGVAETDLRPSGRARINGRLVDVQSVGTYIQKGTPVKVLSVGRYVIEVEEAGA
jgi:membrane-bound serine protease (ClpP class)